MWYNKLFLVSLLEPNTHFKPCNQTPNGGCAQICTNHGTAAVCSCRTPDYKLGQDGKSCDMIHPCDRPDNGGCSQMCMKNGTATVCSCRTPDYKLGRDGKSCDKIRSCDKDDDRKICKSK